MVKNWVPWDGWWLRWLNAIMQKGIHGPVAYIEQYMLASDSCRIVIVMNCPGCCTNIHCLKFHLPVLLEIWPLTEVEATGQCAESKALTLRRVGRKVAVWTGRARPALWSTLVTCSPCIKLARKSNWTAVKYTWSWKRGENGSLNYPLLRDGSETEISHGLLSIAGGLFTLTICFSSLDHP